MRRLAWIGVMSALVGSVAIPAGAGAVAADQATCFIYPFDAVSGSFRGAGFGTPQAVAENVTVKAQDHAAFQVACASLDSPPTGFSMDVDFRFEEEVSSGVWSTVGDSYHCSAGSEGFGLTQVAALSVPSTEAISKGNCDFRQFYDENDPTIFRRHRAYIEVSTSMGDELEGASLPWDLN